MQQTNWGVLLVALICLSVGIGWLMHIKKNPVNDPYFKDVPKIAGIPDGSPMPKLRGKWVTLDKKEPDWKGKVTLVIFWSPVEMVSAAQVNTWNEFIDSYGSKGVVVLGPTVANDKIVAEFVKKSPVKMIVMSDCDDKTLKDFNIQLLPSSYLFDRGGQLVWKGTIFMHEGDVDIHFEKALTEALRRR